MNTKSHHQHTTATIHNLKNGSIDSQHLRASSMQHSQGCWPKKKPSQQAITNQLLIDGAPAPAEGQLSTTLAAELWFILVSKQQQHHQQRQQHEHQQQQQKFADKQFLLQKAPGRIKNSTLGTRSNLPFLIASWSFSGVWAGHLYTQIRVICTHRRRSSVQTDPGNLYT